MMTVPNQQEPLSEATRSHLSASDNDWGRMLAPNSEQAQNAPEYVYKERTPWMVDMGNPSNPNPRIWMGKKGDFHPLAAAVGLPGRDVIKGLINHLTNPPTFEHYTYSDDPRGDIAIKHAERMYYQQNDDPTERLNLADGAKLGQTSNWDEEFAKTAPDYVTTNDGAMYYKWLWHPQHGLDVWEEEDYGQDDFANDPDFLPSHSEREEELGWIRPMEQGQAASGLATVRKDQINLGAHGILGYNPESIKRDLVAYFSAHFPDKPITWSSGHWMDWVGLQSGEYETERVASDDIGANWTRLFAQPTPEAQAATDHFWANRQPWAMHRDFGDVWFGERGQHHQDHPHYEDYEDMSSNQFGDEWILGDIYQGNVYPYDVLDNDKIPTILEEHKLQFPEDWQGDVHLGGKNTGKNYCFYADGQWANHWHEFEPEEGETIGTTRGLCDRHFLMVQFGMWDQLKEEEPKGWNRMRKQDEKRYKKNPPSADNYAEGWAPGEELYEADRKQRGLPSPTWQPIPRTTSVNEWDKAFEVDQDAWEENNRFWDNRQPWAYDPTTKSIWFGEKGQHHDAHPDFALYGSNNAMAKHLKLGDIYMGHINPYDQTSLDMDTLMWMQDQHKLAFPEDYDANGDLVGESTPTPTHRLADADQWHSPGMSTINEGVSMDNDDFREDKFQDDTSTPTSTNTNWVYINGQVAFGNDHSDTARSLAHDIGLDATKASYVSNLVARNTIPNDMDVAVGTITNDIPQIWLSSVDRNAVWDAVMRVWQSTPPQSPTTPHTGSSRTTASPLAREARVGQTYWADKPENAYADHKNALGTRTPYIYYPDNDSLFWGWPGAVHDDIVRYARGHPGAPSDTHPNGYDYPNMVAGGVYEHPETGDKIHEVHRANWPNVYVEEGQGDPDYWNISPEGVKILSERIGVPITPERRMRADTFNRDVKWDDMFKISSGGTYTMPEDTSGLHRFEYLDHRQPYIYYPETDDLYFGGPATIHNDLHQWVKPQRQLDGEASDFRAIQRGEPKIFGSLYTNPQTGQQLHEVHREQWPNAYVQRAPGVNPEQWSITPEGAKTLSDRLGVPLNPEYQFDADASRYDLSDKWDDVFKTTSHSNAFSGPGWAEAGTQQGIRLDGPQEGLHGVLGAYVPWTPDTHSETGLPRPIYDNKPVPWTSMGERDPFGQPIPNFSAIDSNRQENAWINDLCVLCGEALTDPVSAIYNVDENNIHTNNAVVDGGMHPRCAKMTIAHCPHIAVGMGTTYAIMTIPLASWGSVKAMRSIPEELQKTSSKTDLTPVPIKSIDADADEVLTKFWHDHDDLRKACLAKYGYDPIDEKMSYWEYGLAEPEHKALADGVVANDGAFSLELAKRWTKGELEAAKTAAFEAPKVVQDRWVAMGQCPKCQSQIRSENGKTWCTLCPWEKTSMAEQSGDPQLDGLVQQFMTEHHDYIDMYRNGDDAEGVCDQVSEFFVGWLKKQGVDAILSAHSADHQDGDNDDQWYRLKDFGMEDSRGEQGPDDYHYTAIATMPSGKYSIDFTASQFGHEEFPRIQKLDQGQWGEPTPRAAHRTAAINRRLRGFWPRLSADVAALARKQREQLLNREDILKLQETDEGLPAKRLTPDINVPVMTDYLRLENILTDTPDEGFKLMPWIVREYKRGLKPKPEHDPPMPDHIWQQVRTGIGKFNRRHAQDIIDQAVKWMVWSNEHNKPLPDYMSKTFDFHSMEQWVYDMTNANAENTDAWTDSTTVYKFDNGYTIDRVGPGDLEREGELMGHCVGGYCSQVEHGDSTIFSLRDPKGQPHVTIEAKGEWGDIPEDSLHNMEIVQEQGKQNYAPLPEYKTMIDEWYAHLESKGVQVEEYFDEEEWYADPNIDYHPPDNVYPNTLAGAREYHDAVMSRDPSVATDEEGEIVGDGRDRVWWYHTPSHITGGGLHAAYDDRKYDNYMKPIVLQAITAANRGVDARHLAQVLYVAAHHMLNVSGREGNALLIEMEDTIEEWKAGRRQQDSANPQQALFDQGQKEFANVDKLFGWLKAYEYTAANTTRADMVRTPESHEHGLYGHNGLHYPHTPGMGMYPDNTFAGSQRWNSETRRYEQAPNWFEQIESLGHFKMPGTFDPYNDYVMPGQWMPDSHYQQARADDLTTPPNPNWPNGPPNPIVTKLLKMADEFYGFHAAHPSDRDSIMATGLQSEEGVWLWPTRLQAESYGGTDDIWMADLSGLDVSDEIAGGKPAYHTYDSIPPNRLTLDGTRTAHSTDWAFDVRNPPPPCPMCGHELEIAVGRGATCPRCSSQYELGYDGEVIPSDNTVEDMAHQWPDTLPWGEKGNDYYRTASNEQITQHLVDKFGPDGDPDWEGFERQRGMPEHVYRTMSEEDFQASMARGWHKSDERNNYRAQGFEDADPEGTVANAWPEWGYLSNAKDGLGRMVKIKTHPDDGWQEHPIEPGEYWHTHSQIPTSRFVAWSDPLKYDPRGGPEPFRIAKETPNQRMRAWQEMDLTQPPDQSEVVHEFPDGYTIRKLNNLADVHREGVMQRNCWQQNRRIIGDDGQGLPLTSSYHQFMSLRDPKGLPVLSFNLRDRHLDYGKPYIHSVLGVRNRQPTPRQAEYIRQYRDANGYMTDFLPGDDTWHAARKYGYTDHPKVSAHKTGMAERSGDPELDQLITEYLGVLRHKMKDLADPQWARGACGHESQNFAEWLDLKGVRAYTQVMTDGYAGPDDPHFDDFNYGDRGPGANGHIVVQVEMPSGNYTVDWTAAQYGYGEFPMVQKKDGEQWQREWTAAFNPVVLEGGGQPSFKEHEAITGAPGSGRDGMRGYILGVPDHIMENHYLVQWYPQDTVAEWRTGEELVSTQKPDLKLAMGQRGDLTNQLTFTSEENPEAEYQGGVTIYANLDGQPIGHLVLFGDGRIGGVDVPEEYQRMGVATAMLRWAETNGFNPSHDWQAMSPEGEAWANKVAMTTVAMPYYDNTWYHVTEGDRLDDIKRQGLVGSEQGTERKWNLPVEENAVYLWPNVNLALMYSRTPNHYKNPQILRIKNVDKNNIAPDHEHFYDEYMGHSPEQVENASWDDDPDTMQSQLVERVQPYTDAYALQNPGYASDVDYSGQRKNINGYDKGGHFIHSINVLRQMPADLRTDVAKHLSESYAHPVMHYGPIHPSNIEHGSYKPLVHGQDYFEEFLNDNPSWTGPGADEDDDEYFARQDEAYDEWMSKQNWIEEEDLLEEGFDDPENDDLTHEIDWHPMHTASWDDMFKFKNDPATTGFENRQPYWVNMADPQHPVSWLGKPGETHPYPLPIEPSDRAYTIKGSLYEQPDGTHKHVLYFDREGLGEAAKQHIDSKYFGEGIGKTSNEEGMPVLLWRAPGDDHRATHDYDPSWDYELATPPTPQEATQVAQLAQRLHENTRLPFEVWAADLSDTGAVAMFCNGTGGFPVILLDIHGHKGYEDQYYQSMAHELQHGIQEQDGRDFDEDEAENWHMAKKVTATTIVKHPARPGTEIDGWFDRTPYKYDRRNDILHWGVPGNLHKHLEAPVLDWYNDNPVNGKNIMPDTFVDGAIGRNGLHAIWERPNVTDEHRRRIEQAVGRPIIPEYTPDAVNNAMAPDEWDKRFLEDAFKKEAAAVTVYRGYAQDAPWNVFDTPDKLTEGFSRGLWTTDRNNAEYYAGHEQDYVYDQLREESDRFWIARVIYEGISDDTTHEPNYDRPEDEQNNELYSPNVTPHKMYVELVEYDSDNDNQDAWGNSFDMATEVGSRSATFLFNGTTWIPDSSPSLV